MPNKTQPTSSTWQFKSFKDWVAETPFLNHSSRIFYPEDKKQIQEVVPNYPGGKHRPPWNTGS